LAQKPFEVPYKIEETCKTENLRNGKLSKKIRGTIISERNIFVIILPHTNILYACFDFGE
jgi:hypothetical protein